MIDPKLTSFNGRVLLTDSNKSLILGNVAEGVKSNDAINKKQLDEAIIIPFVYVNVKSYGAVGDGIVDDTTAIQLAIDTIANTGGGVILFPYGTYNVTSIKPRSKIRLEGVNWSTIQSISLTNEDIIKRDDTTIVVNRFQISNLSFVGNESGETYTSGYGLNLCGISNGHFENINVSRCGYAGILIGSCHSNLVGGQFTTCTRDGNYNTFLNVTVGSCGYNHTDFLEGTGILLGYRANSNIFNGIFLKGELKCGININWGNNNSFFGLTFESIEKYGIVLKNSINPLEDPLDGGKVLCNCFYNPRFESVGTSGNDACIYFGDSVSNNSFFGLYVSTYHALKHEEGTNHNTILSFSEATIDCFIPGNEEGSLNLRQISPITPSDATSSDLIVGRKEAVGDINLPIRLILRSTDTSVATNQLIASYAVYSSDNSVGGNEINSEIRFYADDTAGSLRMEFWTGGGIFGSIAKRLTIKANGQIIPELSTYADNAAAISGGLIVGALYKNSSGAVYCVI